MSYKPPNREVASILLVGGLLAILFGVLLGSVSVQADGLDCGSVFAPAHFDTQRTADDLVKSATASIACNDVRYPRGAVIVLLFTVGTMAAIIGAMRLARSNRSGLPSEPLLADQLQSLTSLHQSGALTDEQYESAKAKVLADPPSTTRRELRERGAEQN